MPELLEIEAYRQLAEAKALNRKIVEVVAPDAWWLKGGLTAEMAADALTGRKFTVARRIGKRLLMETSAGGPVLGLKFGMTGRLLVDGAAGVDDLRYSSLRENVAWDRFLVRFAGGGDLRVRDPRRLGGAELDPEETKLGPDAASITPAVLGRLLTGSRREPSRTALKARLMDQAKISGLGNLLVDEILYQAALDPARPAGILAPTELKRLHRWIRRTLVDLGARGGSHTGELDPARLRGGVCPKDGTPLERRTIGGRTTYSCPRHQV